MASWSVERCSVLISLWENYPWLFDPAHPDYAHREKAKSALTEIARALGNGITENDVKQKMRSLRTSFLQQLTSYNARVSAHDAPEPAWTYWKALSFLKPFIKPRKRQDNLISPLSPEEETGDMKVFLSVATITEELAEASAAPPSPSVYQQTPPSETPDCANKRRADNSDIPSPAQQVLEILKNMQKAREERRKAREDLRKATCNELFFRMVARSVEDFSEDIQHQLQFDIYKMIHETKAKLLNTK